MDPFTAARIRMSSTTGAEVKRFARVRKEGFEYDFKTSARKEKLGIANRLRLLDRGPRRRSDRPSPLVVVRDFLAEADGFGL
jgi:hypothetical protein